VWDHTYLAEILTNKHDLRPEIEKEIKKANRANRAFLVLKNHKGLRAETIKMCKTLIRLVETYGADYFDISTVHSSLFTVWPTIVQ
jgi:hypothetical protein